MSNNKETETAPIKYVVVTSGGVYLKGTVWTSNRARAWEFSTVESATQALAAAKKFMLSSAYKAAQIVTA